MSRVVFIIDMHLRMMSRWLKTRRIMDWCVAEYAEIQPDVIVLGDDLFHERPTVDELRAAAEWLRALADIAPVVGVVGNHDVPGVGRVLSLVKARHPILIVERPGLHVVAGIEFALLPWPRKAELLALLGDAGSQEARNVGAELLLDVVRGFGTTSTHDGPRCFVGHVQLRGAKVSTGQPLAPGADFELGLEDLSLARCWAYLLGHIHLPADFEIAVPGALSRGAPCLMGGSFRRTAYGEVEEKSLVVVDFNRDSWATARRIPIPCQLMLLLEAEWTGEQWDRDPYPPLDQLSGSDIRFRYRYPKDQADAAHHAAESLRAGLLADGADAVKLDPQVIPGGDARAPEVAKARTVGEKLAALWKARGTTPDENRQTRLLEKASLLDTEVA